MPPVGLEPTTPVSDGPQTLVLDRSGTGIHRFEPTTPAGERPQTCALEQAATAIGGNLCKWVLNMVSVEEIW